jgi:hypothetical protein
LQALPLNGEVDPGVHAAGLFSSAFDLDPRAFDRHGRGLHRRADQSQNHGPGASDAQGASGASQARCAVSLAQKTPPSSGWCDQSADCQASKKRGGGVGGRGGHRPEPTHRASITCCQARSGT